MKRYLLFLSLTLIGSTLSAAVVEEPLIRPQWSGAEPGVWTMDYKAALAEAKADGQWTLMLYSGMWWCPYCQPLEAKVFDTQLWKNYAAENGYYLTVLDFPNRAGTGYWCWLWDEGYRAEAGLTPEEATQALIERFKVQNQYALANGIVTTNANVVVTVTDDGATTNKVPYAAEPETVYRRIGYPTVLVLNPKGKVVDRFTPIVNAMEPEEAFAYVTNLVERAKAGGSVTVGVAEGEETRGTATKYDGWLKYGESVSLTAKANRGYAFAGWIDDESPSEDTSLDYRQAGNTLVASGADTDLRAHFATAAEDALSFDCSLELSYFIPGEEVDIALDIESATFPTVKVTGLPKGLSFDAKTLRVTGAAKTPGTYVITLTAQNVWGYKFTQIVSAFVDRIEGARLTGSDQECEVGETFSADVGELFGLAPGAYGVTLSSVKITGLPKGLSQSKDGQTVSGRPTVAGSYVVTGVGTLSDGTSETATLFFDVAEPESEAEYFVNFDCLEDLTVGTAVTADDLEFGTFEEGEGITAVSGLPTGLKGVTWTDDGVKYFGAAGTLTKAGSFTVTATVKYKNDSGKTVSEKVSRAVIVGDAPYRYIGAEVMDATNCPACTATGGGVTAPGKTVRLTAKAAKNFVFAGWHDVEGEPVANDGVVDFRNPTRSVTCDEDVQSLWCAKFVTTAADKEHGVAIDGVDGAEFNLDAAEFFDETFSVDSLSLPTVKVTGLPAGMACDAVSDETGAYHLRFDPETAKKIPTPGRYSVTLTVSNASKASDSATFAIVVANWTSENINVPDDYGIYKPGVALTVGGDVNPTIFLTNAVDFARGDTLTVSGLPKGMTYNAKADKKKGVLAQTITGTPTVPGFYTITFTSKVLGKTCQATSSITVESFPALTVEIDEDAAAAGNKVTGQKSATYIAGSKVTLKAVAAAGWVFAGWEGDVELSGRAALNPTLSYVTGEDPATIVAKFVRLSEDELYVQPLSDLVGTNTLLLAKGADLAQTVCSNLVAESLQSVSLPSVSVAGLPTGAKFSSATLALSGKVTTPGHAYVTVTAKNAGGYSYVRVWHFCVLNADGSAPTESADVNTAEAEFFGFDDLMTGVPCAKGDLAAYLPVQEGTESAVAKVAVTGLPSGLTAKTTLLEDGDAEVVCTGTPSKPGRYTLSLTVTYANRKTAKASLTAIVEDGGSDYLEVVSLDSERGTVKGSGVYAAGQTVRLTATAKAKHYFSGWFYAPVEEEESGTVFDLLCDLDGIDYRSPSVSFPFRPAEMKTLTLEADFVTAAEDTAMTVTPDDTLWEIDASADSSFPVTLASFSLPKTTITGLPKGVSWNAGREEFVYDASSAALLVPGIYTVTVKAVNQSKKTDSASFQVVVPNVESDYIGGLESDPFAYAYSTGAAFDPEAIVPEVEDGWKLSVSGLPKGLSWKNGQIVGVPTKAGYYTVTFTATTGSGASKQTEKATIIMTIESLPKNASGSFVGVLTGTFYDPETEEDVEIAAGTLSVSVTTAGKITAKVVRPTGTEQFSASVWDSLDLDGGCAAVDMKKGKSTLSLELEFADAWSNVVISTVYVSGETIARTGRILRNSFKDDADATAALKPLVGTYAFKAVSPADGDEWVLEESESDATLQVVVKADGTVSLAGKIGSNKVSGTTQMSYDEGGFVVPYAQMIGGDSTLSVSLRFAPDGAAVSGDALLYETDCQNCGI